MFNTNYLVELKKTLFKVQILIKFYLVSFPLFAKWGSGSCTAVEWMLHETEIAGSNPAWRWTFFCFSASFLSISLKYFLFYHFIQNFEKTNFHFNQLNCSCFFDQPCPCHVKQTLRMPRNSISSCRETWQSKLHSRMQHLSPNSHLNLLKAFLNAFQTIWLHQTYGNLKHLSLWCYT